MNPFVALVALGLEDGALNEPPLAGVVTDAVVGAATSQLTVLSVDVEALLVLPAGSETAPAAIVAVTVPVVVMPLTAAVNVVPSFGAASVIVTAFVPPAPPPIETSGPVKVEVSIGSLKMTVKLVGLVFVGSA